jgi:ubiquitin-activating enzyme E1
VEAFTERVSPDTEKLFNEEFWSGLDGVCNALDNIKARKYVDSKCVFFGKHLFESGTLGTQCNS